MKKIFIIILAFMANTIFAIDPVILTGDKTEYPIGLYVEILEDKTGKQTLDDVRKKEVEALWVKSDKEVPSFGYTKSAFWVRFKTSAPLNEKYLLNFEA